MNIMRKSAQEYGSKLKHCLVRITINLIWKKKILLETMMEVPELEHDWLC